MDKLTRIYILLAIIITFTFSILYFLFPQLRQSFISEDQFLENLTAILYFCSFFLGLFYLIRLKNRKYKRAYILIPLIGILSFLEEVSYGQRILNFRIPRINDLGIDAVHDIVILILKFLNSHGNLLLYIFVIMLFVTVFFLFVLKIRKSFSIILDWFTLYRAYRYVIVFIVFMILAQIIDIYVFKLIEAKEVSIFKIPGGEKTFIFPKRFEILWFIEELSELNGSIALLFATFSMKHEE